jgi:hypothetical protein
VDFARKFVDFTIAGESKRASRRDGNNTPRSNKNDTGTKTAKGKKNTTFSSKRPQKSDNKKSASKAMSKGTTPKSSTPQKQRDQASGDRRGRRK